MKNADLKEERQKQIHGLLAAHGRLTAEELSERLNVTSMTIRRDLDEMQGAGLLLRVHGGVVLSKPFVREQSFSEKATRNLPEKRAIALHAAQMLAPGSSVYLDTGTTAAMVAQLLPAGLNLRIHTNNLRAVMDLFGRQDLLVHVFGGMLTPRNPDLVGSEAVERIMQTRTDVALLGADAIDPESGEIFAADAETAALSRIAQRQAGRSIFLVDSSKIGACGNSIIGRLASGVTLVTDDALSSVLRRHLKKQPIEVLYTQLS